MSSQNPVLRRNLLRHGFLALCVVTATPLTGVCDPSIGGASSDRIRLDFVRTNQDELQFRLTNQSSRTIQFRGYIEKSKTAYPWDFQMKCKRSNSDYWEGGPISIVDGMDGTAKVAPLMRVDLILTKAFRPREFVRGYIGGSCRLHLELLNGSTIESNEFEPQ